MAKGQSYERDACRQLSLWWSEGKHDDWFWRASQSGGRATVRARQGKSTVGHCGDVAATCQEAMLLTKFVTFEIKRGYNRLTVLDMLDKLDKHKGERYIHAFFKQAIEAKDRAGTPFWAVVHRRDQRHAMIYLPSLLAKKLPVPTAYIRLELDKALLDDCFTIYVYRFADFLDNDPDVVRSLAEDYR